MVGRSAQSSGRFLKRSRNVVIGLTWIVGFVKFVCSVVRLAREARSNRERINISRRCPRGRGAMRSRCARSARARRGSSSAGSGAGTARYAPSPDRSCGRLGSAAARARGHGNPTVHVPVIVSWARQREQSTIASKRSRAHLAVLHRQHDVLSPLGHELLHQIQRHLLQVLSRRVLGRRVGIAERQDRAAMVIRSGLARRTARGRSRKSIGVFTGRRGC